MHSQQDEFYSIFLQNIFSVITNLALHELTWLYIFYLQHYLNKLIKNKNYLLNKCSIQYLLYFTVARILFIMNDLYISSINIHFIPEWNSGIIFIDYIYSVSKHYYVNLIRASSAFAFDLIKNLCALWHYIKAYYVC